MPSLSQTMVAVGLSTQYAAEKRNARIRPSLIMIDNVLGAQDAIINVVDNFTPAVSNGVPVPVAQTINRLSINVSMMACVSIRDELKDVIILGALTIEIGIADAACIVTVAWDFE